MSPSAKTAAPAAKTGSPARKPAAKAPAKKAAAKTPAVKVPAKAPAVKIPAKVPAVKAPASGGREAMLARVEQVRLRQREEGNFDCFGRAEDGFCDQGGCAFHAECLSVSRLLHSL